MYIDLLSNLYVAVLCIAVPPKLRLSWLHKRAVLHLAESVGSKYMYTKSRITMHISIADTCIWPEES